MGDDVIIALLVMLKNLHATIELDSGGAGIILCLVSCVGS